MSVNQEKIEILDKTYTIACPEDERHALHDSAKMLDERMRHIRDNDKVMGTERIAIIAALNIAHDLLTQQSAGVSEDVEQRIQQLTLRIENELK
ncbi:MAG: cell division protein ZapA [Gammaproteobacteria bacterium]|nr:cell division protein ZapA [Gammaproteobacteria bacterium]